MGELGLGVGGYFGKHRTDDVTSTMGWWDERTKVSYGDDEILFQYFTFELLILPWTKLIIAVLSQPCKQHVI